jgi:hypothetical protein
VVLLKMFRIPWNIAGKLFIMSFSSFMFSDFLWST